MSLYYRYVKCIDILSIFSNQNQYFVFNFQVIKHKINYFYDMAAIIMIYRYIKEQIGIIHDDL